MTDNVSMPHEVSHRALTRLRWFLPWYGIFTFAVSFLSLWIGASEDFSSPIGVALGLLGLYGVGCATAMFVCWLGIQRRHPESIRWTRWTMITAIPGGVLTGLPGGLVFFGAVVSDATGGTGAVWLLGAAGLGCALAGIFNVYMSVRLAVSNEFDNLLWAETSSRLRVGLNYDEEESEL